MKTCIGLCAGLAATVTLLTGCGQATEPHTAQATHDTASAWDQVEDTVWKHEDLIAACMAESGWNYIPHLPSDVALQREAMAAQAEKRAARTAAELGLPADPNEAETAKLRRPDQEAWATALWGDEDAGGHNAGCYRTTYVEAWGVDPFSADTAAQAQRVEQTIAQDPRVVAAEQAYVACMKAGGITVTDTDDLLARHVLAGEELASREATEGATDELARLRDEWRAAYLRDSQIHEPCFAAYDHDVQTVRAEVLGAEGVW